MANLFWKSKSGIKSLLATPFKTEEEFERTIFDASELLEEVFLLKRQIRGGSKSGLARLVEQREWTPEVKFNKHYCGFKAGFFNAFGIQWTGSKTFAFFAKMSEKEAKQLSPKMTKYDSQWKQAYYYIEPAKTKVGDYASVFEFAYRKLTGEQG